MGSLFGCENQDMDGFWIHSAICSEVILTEWGSNVQKIVETLHEGFVREWNCLVVLFMPDSEPEKSDENPNWLFDTKAGSPR
jgi:hypothetical protein